MKKRKIKYKYLAVSIAVTICMVVFAIYQNEKVTTHFAIKKLLLPIVRLLSFITVGLAIGQIIETCGWTKKISVFTRPIFKFSKLGDLCGAAFIAAFFSGVVSNSMLVDFYQENKISRMHLFLTNYLNQLPAYLLHIPTTVFIVLPLTGFAGFLYFLLTFFAVLLRFVIVLIFGRLYFSFNLFSISKDHLTGNLAPNMIPVKFDSSSDDIINNNRTKTQKIVLVLEEKLFSRAVGVFIWVIPIYTFVFVLNSYDFFDYINNIVSTKISANILPVHSFSVIILSFAAEFTSGFAAAGALMDAGIISTKETVIALLLGNIIAFPIRALRHQFPRYLGIFSPKLGISLLFTGQGFRILSLIIVGLLYYMVG